MDVPGLTPTSPINSPDPVLVNIELPKATKLAAEPKLGATASTLARTPDEGLSNTTKCGVFVSDRVSVKRGVLVFWGGLGVLVICSVFSGEGVEVNRRVGFGVGDAVDV